MTLQRHSRIKRGTKGLRTRTGLHAKKPLERRTPLARVSAKRLASGPTKPRLARPAVPPATRRTLADRSGGICEIGLPGCVGEAHHAHHRITTKNGGRHGDAKVEHDRLSDLLHACWLCHYVVTKPPSDLKVYDLGLCLEEWQKPAEEPTWYRGRTVYVDDLGGVHEYEAVGA